MEETAVEPSVPVTAASESREDTHPRHDLHFCGERTTHHMIRPTILVMTTSRARKRSASGLAAFPTLEMTIPMTIQNRISPEWLNN